MSALTFHGTDRQAAAVICDAISTLASCNDICKAEREAFGQLGACKNCVLASLERLFICNDNREIIVYILIIQYVLYYLGLIYYSIETLVQNR